MKKIHLQIIREIAIFVLVASAYLIVQMNWNAESTEENTTEFSAVVNDVQKQNVRDCVLSSTQSDNMLRLTLDDVKTITGLDATRILKNGETVYFRVQNKWIPQDPQAVGLPFVPIVSLRTETQDIMTLEEYNAWARASRMTTTYAVIAVCTMLVIIIVTCTVFLIRRKKEK